MGAAGLEPVTPNLSTGQGLRPPRSLWLNHAGWSRSSRPSRKRGFPRYCFALAIVLAFVFSYALTLGPILKAGVPMQRAARLTLASDTLSIATMELVDNAFIVLVPGAIAAGLTDSLFWWSLIVSLVVAFVITVPVNRWLILRGRGHAVVHDLH